MAFKISNVNIIDDSRNILNALAIGIGTTNPTSKLWVDGDGYFTGVTTASRFVSNVAQGTAPISVASSTLVTNLNANYLNGQSGSYYNTANNLTGTAPASVITQSSGLTVSGNLNVSGNVSIGGTTTLVYAQQLQISDRDITLGVTTDSNANDVSTDITANHGGISIASTVGAPIINIPIDAVNNSPSTYKQLMWIKQGHYSGLGTDAWVFNYAVSIGNTASVQNLSRLTVGAGFTVFDTYLDVQDIRARNITTVNNINATGVTTSGGFSATTGTDYKINGTSVLNSTTLGSAVVNSSLTSVGTLPTLNATNITNTNINSAGINTAASYYVGATTVLSTVSSQIRLAGIATIDATTRATLERELAFAPNDFDSLNVSGISTLQSTTLIGGGTSTGTALQRLQVTGGAYVSGNLGIGTTNPQTKLEINGVLGFTGGNVRIGDNTTGSSLIVGSANNNNFLGFNAGQNTTSGQNNNFLGYRAGVANTTGGENNFFGYLAGSFNTTGGSNNFFGYLTGSSNTTGTDNIFVGSNAGGNNQTGSQNVVIGKDQNAPILNGSNQLVIGAGSTSWIVGNSSYDIGIGITNPTTKLDVNGSVRFRSSITDNNNATGSANQVLTATSAGAGVSWATISASSIGAISGVTVTNDTSTATPLYLAFTSSTGTTITGVSVDSAGLSYIPSGAGSLGIGTTSPTRNLDVNGDARIRGGIRDVNDTVGSASSVLTANGSGGWSWQPVTSTGAISGINVSQDDTGVRYPLFAAGTNASTTTQYVDTTSLVYNTSSNCLGIGSLTPTSRLDIIGDVKVVGVVTASDFNSSSDIKLKTNIQRIANPIEKVLQINGVSFNWKESGKATMGVIAQEVELVMPELVSNTDPKSVNYNGLIGLLIECVKDQQRQIDELRNIT